VGKTMHVENLPPGWQTASLEDVAEYINGYGFGPSEWDTEGLPIIRIQNLNDPDKPYNFFKGRIADKYRVLHGDILISWAASLGAYKWTGTDAWVNQHIFKVVVNENAVHADFFYWVMRKQIEKIAESAHGSTMKHVTRQTFLRSRIVLPPLPEQRAIARTLRAVQEAKEARRREIAVERERKAALMQHLFTHGVRNEPRKQTAIGEMPESWRVTQLGDVSNLLSGGTPPKDQPDSWKGTVPWVSPKDMKQPRLRNVSDHISEDAARERSRIVPAGSVFVVVRGMILAKDVPIAIAEVPMAFNQDMKAILPCDDLYGDYLLYVLKYLKHDLYRIIGTSAHGTRRMGTAALEAMLLPLPCLDEQKIIADALITCDTKIAALEREAGLLDELFRAMLEELMGGRLSAVGGGE